MRVVSIGHPLRHASVDNHTIFNAPALLDYDAIVVDPGRVFDSIREAVESVGTHETHSGLPVANGETSTVTAGIAEALHRRRDEVVRSLGRGAVVAVFAHPQATLPEVSGFSGVDRYFFLPAPPGLGWDARLLRGGEGRECAVVDHGHPFAAVIDLLREDLLYRAYFDDRVEGFAAAAHVIARSPGGAPLAASFAVGGGTVVFLPAPREIGGDRALNLGGAIVAAMTELVGRSQAAPPPWVARVELPRLAALQATEEGARAERDAAQRALEQAEQASAELSVLRDVLWREGDLALLPPAVQCMLRLGFRESGEAHRLQCDEGDLWFEVAGSEAAVGMQPHYRLRERLDTVIAEQQRAPRGLVIANGHRLRAPDAREQQFTESLRVAAEATGYALLTAPQLFEAVRAALDGAGDELLAALRRRLLGVDGLVELDDLLASADGGEGQGG